MTTGEKQMGSWLKSASEATMLRYVLLEMKRKPVRTLGTVLGFALGVSLFAVCSVLVYSNNHRLWRTLSNTGTHFIAYKPVCCETPYIDDRENQGFFANGTPTNPFRKTVEAAVAGLGSVNDAAAAIQFRINTPIGYLTITGVPLDRRKSVAANACSAADVVAGRYFTETDTHAVVLDADFAKIHNYRPGQSLTLPDGRYDIIGVAHTGVKPLKTDLFMPYRVAEKTIDHYTHFTMAGLSNLVLVESKNALVHQTALDEVQNILGENGITASYNCHKPSSKAISINSGITSALIAVNIFFLVLYTYRTHRMSISERRKLFGILYSLGWSRKRLVTLTMLEGAIQTVAGSVLGIIVSVPAILLLGRSADILPGIPLQDIPTRTIALRSVELTLVAGLLAGAAPGLTFFRQSPAQIIRGR